MLAVTGYSTTLISELRTLVDEEVVRIGGDLGRFDSVLDIPVADRYVLAAGVLHSKSMIEQGRKDIEASLAVNLVNVIRICEGILSVHGHARICVIGSESGLKWSFDDTYAASKAAVHRYVETRKILPSQQLVCVAPTIIRDSGMTRRRKDYPAVLERRRTVTARQVAEAVCDLLWGPAKSNMVVPVC